MREEIINTLYQNPYFLEQLHSTIVPSLIHAIFWEYDIATKTMHRYGTLSETYSEESTISNYTETLLNKNIIHKDDKTSFSRFFERLSTDRTFMTSTMRYQNQFDVYNWHCLQGMTLLDESGNPVRIFGTITNIEKQKSDEISPAPLMKKSKFSKTITDYLKLYRNSPFEHCFLMIELDNYDQNRRTFGKTLLENITSDAIIELKNIFSEQILGQLSPSTFVVFYPEVKNKKAFLKQMSDYINIVQQLYDDPDTFSMACSIGVTLEHDMSDFLHLHQKSLVALHTAQNKGGNCFDFYGELKKQKTSKTPTPLEEALNSSPNFSFLQQCFDLLENNDVESAIYHYLFQVCQYYKADHTYIMLKNQVEETFSVAYQYSTPTCVGDISSLYQFPIELADEYMKLFDSNHCYFCSDFSEIEKVAPSIVDSYRLTKVDSFLQYAFYENDDCIGMLGIDICSEQSDIQPEQLASFYFIGKFLDYMLKKLQRKCCTALPYNRDKLTGLLSFPEFIHYGEQLIRENATTNYALISCNIHNFKGYNKNYGITTGNKILKEFADSLLISLRDNEICTRVSADQFALLLTYDTLDEKLLSRLVTHSNHSLHNPQSLPDYYRLDVGYGICPISESSSFIDAFEKAVRAKNSLKVYSGNRYAIYGEERKIEEEKIDLLKKSFQEGFENEQFIPYYQPKFSLEDNKLVGFEALARFNRPSCDLKYPNDFLSIMEEDYDTIELDFQIIQAVCKDLQTALSTSQKVYPVSINLSPAHLITTNFANRLMFLVEHYQVPISYLQFEITEDFFKYHKEEAICFISELNELGFSVILDNFETNYASFHLLYDIDISAINLDISFFEKKYPSKKEEILSRKMIETANELGIKINVKKIEEQSQLDTLPKSDCESAQGFYFSRALPFEQIQNKYF